MNYIVNPFLITEISDGAVIQNSKKTVVIKDSDLINFFNVCEKNNKYGYTYEELDDYFNSKIEIVLDFLKDNNLIKEETIPNIDYKSITVVSNDTVFLDSILFNTQGIDKKINIKNIKASYEKFEVTDYDSLYIVFLNPFDFQTLHNIVDKLKEANVISKVCFYYNHKIYMSNFYKKQWFNPCPICFFGNVEATLRGKSKALNTVPFQSLLDYIYNKKPNFKIENKFSPHQLVLFVQTLIENLAMFDNRHANLVNYIDFNNNSVGCDEAIHWELCDCYE